jgi:hypothetical protein
MIVVVFRHSKHRYGSLEKPGLHVSDLQKHSGCPSGLTPPLLPLVQGANTDAKQVGKFGLRQ